METQLTELAWAVDVMMARAKRIYILIIKVNKLFSWFSSRCFLKETENMFSVFLSSYRNTRESLGEREMLWENEPYSYFYNSIETRYMFSISSIKKPKPSMYYTAIKHDGKFGRAWRAAPAGGLLCLIFVLDSIVFFLTIFFFCFNQVRDEKTF